MDVEQAALGPQPEVVVEDARQLLQLAPEVHHQLQLGAETPGVEPDVAEVPAGRAVRQFGRLEQRDGCAAQGQVVGRRRADDPATDHHDVR